MSGLTPDQVEENNLYVCCAVLSGGEYYARDGAVRLNHLLQERARMTRDQAFQVIADAIMASLIRVADEDNKRLVVIAEPFRRLRDRRIDEIGAVESEVVTMTWTMHAPTGVDESVAEDLRKHVARGRLVDLGGTRAGRAFIAIDKLLSASVIAGFAEHVDGEALAVVEAEAEGMADAVAEHIDSDFVVVIARTREFGIVRSVKYFPDVDK